MPEDKITADQIGWFSKLPISARVDGTGGYVKNCFCGESLLVSSGETTNDQINEWIAEHFSHTKLKHLVPKTEFSIHDLYDFSKPVKFSREGFELFVAEYRLQYQTEDEFIQKNVRRFYHNYSDNNGNDFCFEFPDRSDTPAKAFYAEIVPELTEVKI